MGMINMMADGDKAIRSVLHFLSLPGEGSSVGAGCGVLEMGKLRHPVTKAIVCPAVEFGASRKPRQRKRKAG